MSKDLRVSVLMDFYGELLTEKQRETLDYYYNRDFSLAEIAQHMDISRQGVRDFIKRGEKQLADFEEALGLVKKFTEINSRVDELEDIVSGISPENLEDTVPDIFGKLEQIRDLM